MTFRWTDWPQALETAAALSIGWVLVFAVPFQWTARRLGGAVEPVRPVSPAPSGLDRAITAIRFLDPIANRLPWRSTCLVRAVAGRLLLRRRGIPARIRFGVAKSDTGLAAHAWLISGDTIILGGRAASGYTPLADLGDLPQ